MSRVRDIVLRRSKAPAKIFSLEKGGEVEDAPKQQPTPEEPEPPAKAVGTQCDETLLPVGVRVPTPGRGAAARRRGSPAPAILQVRKASEARRPLVNAGEAVVAKDRGSVSNSSDSRSDAEARYDELFKRRGQHQQQQQPIPEQAAQRPGPVERRRLAQAEASPIGARQRRDQETQPAYPAAAGGEGPRRGPKGERGIAKLGDTGKVPNYLVKRKEQMAEARRVSAMPAEPQAPAGYRRVGEDERHHAIDALRKRTEEVDRQIRALPFRIETMGQKRREQELTGRLSQLERLQNMFKQPVVFVPADSEPISDSSIG